MNHEYLIILFQVFFFFFKNIWQLFHKTDFSLSEKESLQQLNSDIWWLLTEVFRDAQTAMQKR